MIDYERFVNDVIGSVEFPNDDSIGSGVISQLGDFDDDDADELSILSQSSSKRSSSDTKSSPLLISSADTSIDPKLTKPRSSLQLNSNINLINSWNYPSEFKHKGYNNYHPSTNYHQQGISNLNHAQHIKPSHQNSNNLIICPQSLHTPQTSRFFVIKSYNEEDVRSSFLHKIWSSTELGNKRLDKAFHSKLSTERIFLVFSVNGSGKFCGIAEMTSKLNPLNEPERKTIWLDRRYNGKFSIQWIYVKDVTNSKFKHINNPFNEWRPITQSRDTQELPHDVGLEVIQIFQRAYSNTSFLENMNWNR